MTMMEGPGVTRPRDELWVDDALFWLMNAAIHDSGLPLYSTISRIPVLSSFLIGTKTPSGILSGLREAVRLSE
jgi:hypothetical protein